MRTRIKICGLTREADVATACAAGADAVGFVCYPNSPRHVAPHRLRALARELGPFTVPVLLFVNAAPDLVQAARDAVPTAVLQFHGDEQEPECARYGAPYVRAVRMAEGVDLLDCERLFPLRRHCSSTRRPRPTAAAAARSTGHGFQPAAPSG